jgi:hypothetical protein
LIVRIPRARSSAWIERLPSKPSEGSRKSRDRSPPGPPYLISFEISSENLPVLLIINDFK